jgi:hypothetical protein
MSADVSTLMRPDESTQAVDPDEDPVEPTADLSRAAGAWVYIAAFAGIALAWSTSLAAPWVGGAAGAAVAFAVGTLVIAARG